MVRKTPRELAYLRDLLIDADWTVKFTELIDEKTFFEKDKRLLYLNAGTGGHVIELASRVDAGTEVVAVCEDEEVHKIAVHKGKAVNSKVDFRTGLEGAGAFEAVMTDGTLTRPADIVKLIGTSAAMAAEGGKIIVAAVSAGSFGEIFSFLWEALENEGLGDHGAAERLITELPMVSELEDAAVAAGLTDVTSNTTVRVFEHKDARTFVSSPLIESFFLPSWLDGIEEDLQQGVAEELAKLIDSESDATTFQFSVKATIVTGQKS